MINLLLSLIMATLVNWHSPKEPEGPFHYYIVYKTGEAWGNIDVWVPNKKIDDIKTIYSIERYIKIKISPMADTTGSLIIINFELMPIQ